MENQRAPSKVTVPCCSRSVSQPDHSFDSVNHLTSCYDENLQVFLMYSFTAKKYWFLPAAAVRTRSFQRIIFKKKLSHAYVKIYHSLLDLHIHRLNRYEVSQHCGRLLLSASFLNEEIFVQLLRYMLGWIPHLHTDQRQREEHLCVK